MTTNRPASPAEIASTAHLPQHKQVVTVETDEDGRAVVGKAKTVHRATVTTYLNAYDESTGRIVHVYCGAERYRNNRSAATAVGKRYDIDCARCLAE